MKAQVGIIGAGPAGLMLAQLLRLAGISAVIIENRSRAYCEQRIRAGLIEQWARDLLIEIGVGERMLRESLFHRGIKLQFGGELHPIDFYDLIHCGVTIYGQQEVVKDMIAALLEAGTPIHFEVEDASVHGIHSKARKIRFRHQGNAQEIDCDFIGGCDGFHGICRPSIPDGVLSVYDRDYPFGWLGILSESPPPDEELIYSYHERGFALFTMRSPTLARLYFQVPPDEDIEKWPDEKIWQELQLRIGGVKKLTEGKILQKAVTPMRSYVVEPMQYGRLFLAGNSAHIVPPTGAKGMNLAFADVRMLARAMSEFYRSGDSALLDGYSRAVLPRVWKAQRFSWWMTQQLHHFPHENRFDRRRQMAELEYLVSSKAAQTSLAENYAGLPLD